MTSGTDFSGCRHALVFPLTEEGESERIWHLSDITGEGTNVFFLVFTPAAALPLEEFLYVQLYSRTEGS